MVACDDAALAGLLEDDVGRDALLDELVFWGDDDFFEDAGMGTAELPVGFVTVDAGFVAADDADTFTADELPELEEAAELLSTDDVELVDRVSDTLEAEIAACKTAAF